MTRSLRSLLLLLGLMIAPMQMATAQGVENPCLSVSATQDALLSGSAMRLADIKRQLDGDIVKADLCRSEGKLAYWVTVLTRDGLVKRVTVDAKSGEPMRER